MVLTACKSKSASNLLTIDPIGVIWCTSTVAQKVIFADVHAEGVTIAAEDIAQTYACRLKNAYDSQGTDVLL
jgi:hypothetical protein